MGAKIGLITGAGSGIGRASAQALWDAGWSLTLAGRREETLCETVSLAGVDDSRALVVPPWKQKFTPETATEELAASLNAWIASRARETLVAKSPDDLAMTLENAGTPPPMQAWFEERSSGLTAPASHEAADGTSCTELEGVSGE